VKLFLKNLAFSVLVPGTVAGYVPWLLVRGTSPAPEGWGIARALYLSGGAIYLWCVWDFATFGRGTPAPIDAPRELVVRGLYRYTRNPMYLGVLTTILGWACLFRSGAVLLYASAVAAGFQLFILFYEEPHLQRTFGRPYADYCRRVGRWLPRIPRSSDD